MATRILIVEDDELFAAHLSAHLQMSGYVIVGVARDADQSLTLALQYLPDVVLMDILLPGAVDGIDAAAAIRARLSVPILYLTAYEDETLFQRAKITDPCAYLLKPTTARELKLAIELALERRQRQQELETRFQATFDQVAVGMAHIAPNGAWLRVNQRLCDIVGYSREEMQQTDFQTITHPDDLPTDLDRVRQLLDSEIATYTLDKRYRRKDGSLVWITQTGSLVRRADGAPDYFLSVVEDISARKASELALAEEAVRRRVLFNEAQDGLCVLNGEWRVVEANPSFARMLGYNADEVLQLYPWDWDMAFPDRQSVLDRWPELPAVAETFESRFRRRDGSIFDAEISLNRAEWGGQTFLFCICRDISERKRLERLEQGNGIVLAALASGESLPSVLRLLVNHMETVLPGAIGSVLLLDPDGRHLRAGAAPSLPQAFNRAIDGAEIGPAAGSCGTAAYRRERVIVDDIAASPLWKSYRDLATLGGVQACWSEPLLDVDGKVLGTFAVYYRTPHVPGETELNSLAIAAHLAVLAISRVRLEDALRISVNYQRVLFENTPVGLALCKMDGRLIDANPAYLRILGRSREETLALTYWDITPERYAAEEQAQLQRMEATGRYGPYEKTYRHRDGHEVPVRLQGLVLPLNGERFIWSSVEDLSEQKRAEAERRTLTERLAMLMESMTDAFVALDRDWRYIYVNRRAGEMFGRDPQTLIGKQIWQEFPEGVDQPFHRAYERAMERRETVLLEEYYAPWGRWFENRIYPTAEGISIYFHDITEHKLMDLELHAANTRLRELSTRLLSLQEEERRHIARELHDEIGQSLTALKITLQSIGMRPETQAFRAQIDTGVEIADVALNQARDLSLSLRPSQLDDLGLAAALRWNLERQAGLAAFTAHFETDGVPVKLPEPIVIACYRIAQEALTNIMRHARAKQVWLRIASDGNMLRLEVQDDGRGFDYPQLKARGSTGGSGLAGMEERATLVGGSLRIDSVVGQGTRLHAVFPLQDELRHSP